MKSARKYWISTIAAAALYLLCPSAEAGTWKALPRWAGGTQCGVTLHHGNVNYQVCLGYSARRRSVQSFVAMVNHSGSDRQIAATSICVTRNGQCVPGSIDSCPETTLRRRRQLVCLSHTVPNQAGTGGRFKGVIEDHALPILSFH